MILNPRCVSRGSRISRNCAPWTNTVTLLNYLILGSINTYCVFVTQILRTEDLTGQFVDERIRGWPSIICLDVSTRIPEHLGAR